MVSCILRNDLINSSTICIQNSGSKLEFIKPLNVCFVNSQQVLESNNKKELLDVSDKDKSISKRKKNQQQYIQIYILRMIQSGKEDYSLIWQP